MCINFQLIGSGLVKFIRETGQPGNAWRKNIKKNSEMLEMIEKGRYCGFLPKKMLL